MRIVREPCALVILLFVAFSLSARAQGERGIAGGVKVDGTWVRHEDVNEIGDYYGLVIAIDRYAAPDLRLQTAVADGKAVAKLLRDQYGFKQVIEVYDAEATFMNIRKAMDELGRRVSEGDSVLIYYAGHGELKAGTGFWIPCDGQPGKLYSCLEHIAARDMIKTRRFNAGLAMPRERRAGPGGRWWGRRAQRVRPLLPEVSEQSAGRCVHAVANHDDAEGERQPQRAAARGRAAGSAAGTDGRGG